MLFIAVALDFVSEAVDGIAPDGNMPLGRTL
jgi:hypothetical protein